MPGALIITIDGPAGTGKSTVAHALAMRLGLEFLDTGAMYRAATLVALEKDIDPSDGLTLARPVACCHMHFDWTKNPPRLLIGDRDVSDRIRDLDVSEQVSIVAGQREVRAVLVEQQRRIAQRHPRLVSEGRDQGSVVFPDADVRFYLDASPEVRAQRRVEQLARAGKSADTAQIARDIARRDELDSTREVGPLIRPEGAIVIDTSDMMETEVVELLEEIIRERIAAKLERNEA